MLNVSQVLALTLALIAPQVVLADSADMLETEPWIGDLTRMESTATTCPSSAEEGLAPY